uniref:Uncharacterized protein n=1 Tax=Mustela putorius furo TaxID=9669 RepID=M3YLH5_MUSPF
MGIKFKLLYQFLLRLNYRHRTAVRRMQKGVLRESAQGRQKRPNKQKPPPPRVGHTAKREPGSSRPDQAVQTPHRPPSTAPGGGSLPLSARAAGRRWQGMERPSHG